MPTILEDLNSELNKLKEDWQTPLLEVQNLEEEFKPIEKASKEFVEEFKEGELDLESIKRNQAEFKRLSELIHKKKTEAQKIEFKIIDKKDEIGRKKHEISLKKSEIRTEEQKLSSEEYQRIWRESEDRRQKREENERNKREREKSKH